MIKSAVRKLILNNATASSLLDAERVFPSRLPNKYSLPSVVLTMISSEPQTMHGGNEGRIEISMVQLTLLTNSESQMGSLKEAVVTALDLKNSTVTLGSDSVEVLASFLEDTQDLQGYEYEKESEIVTTMDFSFIWR